MIPGESASVNSFWIHTLIVCLANSSYICATVHFEALFAFNSKPPLNHSFYWNSSLVCKVGSGHWLHNRLSIWLTVYSAINQKNDLTILQRKHAKLRYNSWITGQHQNIATNQNQQPYERWSIDSYKSLVTWALSLNITQYLCIREHKWSFISLNLK